MRLLTFLAYSAFIFGAIGIAVSRYYDLPKGVHLGIFVVGAGFLIGALESLQTRRMSLRASSEATEAYWGMPAVVWGLMLLIIASALIASAYLLDAGQWYAKWHYLKLRPGALYVAGGLLAAGSGVLFLVNPQGRRVWWKMLLLRTPRVLIGLILLLGGFAAIAMGVWEWLDPREFARFSQNSLYRLDFRTFDGFLKSVSALRR